MKFGVILCSLVLCSCGTIAPRYVTSDSVAMSGTHQDSGIVQWVFNSDHEIIGGLVRQDYAANYFWLVKAYGSKIAPPVTTPRSLSPRGSGFYFADKQTLAQYAELVGVETNSP